MRLTLRTLLAYLDDILEPADARDLGHKIEESEFASGLVHRIRSVTRKLRLGAPKLSGKGMGLDANTVAEYLDNTLPQDRVPDFEKVCLESDVHLAEAASCHQILTLVLGEPADVDPALRERIHSLQARIDALAVEQSERTTEPLPPKPAAAPPVAPPDQDHERGASPQRPPVAEPTVAEPTVAGPTVAGPTVAGPTVGMPAIKSAPAPSSGTSIRLLPLAATLVVAFLLALGALMLMGPLDSNHPILGGMLADATPTETTDTGETTDMGEQGADRSGGTQSNTKPARSSSAAGSAETGTPANAPASLGGGSSAGVKPSDGSADVAPEEPAKGPAAAGTRAFPEPPGGGMKAEPDAQRPALKPDAGATGTTDAAPPGPAPADALPGSAMAADAATGEAATGEAEEPEPLARCMSNLHVLARFDPATETWLRLTANDPIPAQQELIALPTYRPQVTFGSGVQLMLVGPAAVSLRDPGADGVPGLVVHYGRILVTTAGAPDAALNLQIGDRISHLGLPGLDSTLALDVQRYNPPGTNPEEQAARWLIIAQAAGGRLTWRDQKGDATTSLEAGQRMSMIDTGAARVTADAPTPEWLDAKNLRPIDRDASEQLEPRLELNRALSTSLLEQATNRLVEVRSLAIRSLCMLGAYDVFVDAFNSKDYRTFWPDLLFSLQLAVNQDPETAARVRTTFERLRGTEGSRLYRFLWCFSPPQLISGGAEELVEALASNSMDIRVFAYEDLYHIVEKTNSYQPELDPGRQRRAILNWQRDLKQSKIVYKTPPFEVSE